MPSIRISPDSPYFADDCASLATDHCQQERLEAALHSLLIAIDEYTHNGPTYEDLALSYKGLGIDQQDQGWLEEAVASVQSAIGVFPGSEDLADSHSLPGSTQYHQGLLKGATASLQSAIDVLQISNPGSKALATTYVCLGRLLSYQGNHEEAMRCVNNAISILPNFS